MHIKTVDDGRRHRRELWIDDESNVAHLWVIDYTMRIGTAEVRMAGIGGVHTERDHRMKGYMRQLFTDTVTYMTDQGYDVSMLFGIENFYNKFGYAVCLADHRFTVKTRDAEVANAFARPLTPRPIEPADMPAIVSMYNTQNATRSGTLTRAADTFTEFPKGSHWSAQAEAMVWENADGNLLGYVVTDINRKEVTVVEAAAKDTALFPTILAYLAQQAIDKRCEEITVIAPPDYAFSEYVQRFGCEWRISCPRYGDGMLRILNQQALFGKLAPELARRLSGITGVDTIAFETDLGKTTLSPDDAGLKITPDTTAEAWLALSQDKLIQLIMGYRSINDVLNSPDVTLTGNALPVLAALFPKNVAFVWSADHF